MQIEKEMANTYSRIKCIEQKTKLNK